MKKLLAIVLAMFCGPALAHEMSPTYVEFNSSYVENVLETNIEIFNRREDVNFYQIEVFDKDWKSIVFVTTTKIVNLKYLEKKSIDVYIKEADKDKVVYVCTLSRFVKEDVTKTNVSSRICSKVK
jgi:hypothetical protein